MEIFSNLRRLRNRLLAQKEDINPSDILLKLKSVAESRKKIFKDTVYVPDKYLIKISRKDLSAWSPFIKILLSELNEEISRYISSKGYHINTSAVNIDFEAIHTMQKGEFEVLGIFCQGTGDDTQSPAAIYTPDSDTEPEKPNANNVTTIQLIISKDKSVFETLVLAEGVYVIGRGMGADVILPSNDPLVSKSHCRLEFKEGEASIQDLNSVNGTILNGHKLDSVQRLASGDLIKLGNTDIEVYF